MNTYKYPKYSCEVTIELAFYFNLQEKNICGCLGAYICQKFAFFYIAQNTTCFSLRNFKMFICICVFTFRIFKSKKYDF
jgi:hypothetical protein